MKLQTIQRRMWEAVRQPLTADERTRPRLASGRSTRKLAEAIIKPNDRLSSLERLEIYNRSYWFRLLDSFGEDFPGLRAVVGDHRFDALAQAYLAANPSRSFTLRNLGRDLEAWLRKNPKWIRPDERLALDMVRLEWAEIEAFDGAEEAPMTLDDIRRLDSDTTFRLQPYIRILTLRYPVDDLLIAIRKSNDLDEAGASNAFTARKKRGRLRHFRNVNEEKVFLVVHRVDYSVYFKRIDQASYLALHALDRGLPLADAVYAAFADSTIAEKDQAPLTRSWFQDWARWGWFCRPGAPSSVRTTTRKS